MDFANSSGYTQQSNQITWTAHSGIMWRLVVVLCIYRSTLLSSAQLFCISVHIGITGKLLKPESSVMTPENVYASDMAITDCYDIIRIPEDLNTFSSTVQSENINVYHPAYYCQTLPPATQVSGQFSNIYIRQFCEVFVHVLKQCRI